MDLRSKIAWVRRKIKQTDMFGKNITFTYKGRDKYTTLLGGLTSIVILAFMFACAVSFFLHMINREESNSSVNAFVKDLTVDNNVLDLTDSGFSFILVGTYQYNNSIKTFTGNDTVLSMSIIQYSKSYDPETDTFGVNNTSIDYKI